jgi:hypothetical protein
MYQCVTIHSDGMGGNLSSYYICDLCAYLRDTLGWGEWGYEILGAKDALWASGALSQIKCPFYDHNASGSDKCGNDPHGNCQSLEIDFIKERFRIECSCFTGEYRMWSVNIRQVAIDTMRHRQEIANDLAALLGKRGNGSGGGDGYEIVE